MSELAYCGNCLKVQTCKVIRGAGVWEWECEVCGSIADIDFDEDYLEEFEDLEEPN